MKTAKRITKFFATAIALAIGSPGAQGERRLFKISKSFYSHNPLTKPQ